MSKVTYGLGKEEIYKIPPVYEKYFAYKGVRGNSGKNLQAQCKLCLPKINILAYSIRTASNLRTHLQKMHLKHFEELSKTRKSQRLSNLSNGDKTLKTNKRQRLSLDNGDQETKRIKPDLDDADEDLPQGAIEKMIINFVVNGLQPLSICDPTSNEGSAFKALLTGLQPRCPVMSTETLKSSLAIALKNTMDAVKEDMAKSLCVCITTDCWSAHNRIYFGVTAHWIDTLSLKRCHAALSCKSLKGRLTFEVFATELGKILLRYGLQRKVSGVMSDSGVNVVKEFNVLGIDLAKASQEESPSYANSFVNITDLLNKDHMIGSEYTLASQVHYNCTVRTFNLTISKAVEEALLVPAFEMTCRKTLAKCQDLWNNQNTSAVASAVIKQFFGAHLKSPDVITWKSLFNACNQISSLTSNIERIKKMHEVCDILGLARFQRTEIIFLLEYVDIMKPLVTAMDLLQEDGNSCVGYVLPTIYQIITTLADMEDKRRMKFCSPLLQTMINAIMAGFKSILWKRSFVIASCVHPKFRLDWVTGEKRDQAYNWTVDEIIRNTNEMKLTVPASNLDDEFFSFSSCDDSTRNYCKNLYDSFLNDKCQSLCVLNDHNLIKNVFIKYNTTIPSTTVVQDMFTLFQKKHISVDDNDVETMLLLNLNKRYNN